MGGRESGASIAPAEIPSASRCVFAARTKAARSAGSPPGSSPEILMRYLSAGKR